MSWDFGGSGNNTSGQNGSSNNNNTNNSNGPTNNSNGSGWGSNNTAVNNSNPSFNFSGSASAPQPPSSSNGSDYSNGKEAMNHIYAQYKDDNPQCRFQTVLYNQIPDNVHPKKFQKPMLIRSQIWEQGVENNPDPKRLYPVAINGYQELNERSKLCCSAHVKWLKEMEAKDQMIRALREDMEVNTKPMIADMKQTQMHLSHRLLAVLREYVCQSGSNLSGNNALALGAPLGSNQNASNISLHSMAAALPLSLKEMDMKVNLERMSNECREMMARYMQINRMWTQLGIDGENSSIVVSDAVEHIDAKNMKQMFQFLKQQQNFIQLLSNTVQCDMKDLDIIREGTR